MAYLNIKTVSQTIVYSIEARMEFNYIFFIYLFFFSCLKKLFKNDYGKKIIININYSFSLVSQYKISDYDSQ